VPILLALCTAVSYGVADYCGGRSSRTLASSLVTLVGQSLSLVLVAIGLVVMSTPRPDSASLLWGAAGGAVGAAALVLFYFALANGVVTVVAPITAVTSALVPVVWSLADGERPAPVAYLGIVVALVAVALVSGAMGSPGAVTSRLVVRCSLLAGVGFGVIFYAFSRAAEDSGLWPLLAARVSSVPVVAVVVIVTRPTLRLAATEVRWLVPLSGVLDMAANLSYLYASRGTEQLSSVAVVASLYPVSTVALAMAIDRERVSRSQLVGMVLAAVALALVSWQS
jgi:drug/metabolite transporter (DMT)-like permease